MNKWIIFMFSFLLFSFSAVGQVEDEYEEMESDTAIDTTAFDTSGIDDHTHDEFTEDQSFEEFLVEIGYYFDTTMIPAEGTYDLWDTKKIHPYEQKIDSITDSTMLFLCDDDCFFHPPTVGRITSDFGLRRWGRRLKFHYGTDLALNTGDPVYAAFDGVVRIAQYSTSYGYVVVMRHYNGLETIYAHFSKLLVVPGMTIRAGEPIGLGGSTGRSTGAHLHFEMRYKGVAFNPNKVIDFSNNVLKSDTIFIDKHLFDHLKEVKKMKAAKYYRVRSGDTLGHIARRYGTSVSTIRRLNGMRGSFIRVGQVIRVR